MGTTADNPAGIRTFDNQSLARLPEYQLAAAALNDLVQAINKADIGLTQDQWLQAVHDLTTAIPFMDMCSRCRDSLHAQAPAATHIKGGWIKAAYLCHTCGHVWTCGWSTDAPNYT